MSDATTVALRAEGILRPLYVAVGEAWWASNVEASDANEGLRIAAEMALSDALSDAELFAAVEAARAESAEPLIARQLDLIHASMVRSQVPADLRHRIIELETAVEGTFARHRGTVGGRERNDNEINEILRSSDDVAERREAWAAAKTIGAAVADDVRELARLRNEVARRLGYRDWFALSVSASEMDEAKLIATLGACDAATAEPFARWKASTDAVLASRFGCDVAELRPWHYADPFFQEVPAAGGVDLEPVLGHTDVVELARRTFDEMGLPTGGILGRSDLYPREGKCQHAFCIDVDREGDVRVLANVAEGGAATYWADTMLHELGHGAYNLGIADDLPFLLRDCHLTVTEGIAILMGGLAHDAGWLRDVAGLDPAEAESLDGQLRAARAAERLLFTRWVLVMTTFERGLYADPEADHDARWWELVARYQGVTAPDDAPMGAWAAKIHIACAPVYYHTYLYGHLVAAQLRVTLEREAGGLVGCPAAGELLTERIFRHGESLRWDLLIGQATGTPLGVAHFAAELVG